MTEAAPNKHNIPTNIFAIKRIISYALFLIGTSGRPIIQL